MFAKAFAKALAKASAKTLAKAFALTIVASLCVRAESSQISTNRIIIDRRSKEMQVVSARGNVLLRCPVGIGKGGLAPKKSIADSVTPTGEFRVDVILTARPELNAIDSSMVKRFARDNTFKPYVSTAGGLAKLFANMNSLDFNRDGKPDEAYGFAYIGIDGPKTGPKLARLHKVVRWYSIGLHGTPIEKGRIGAMTSEGCIHVGQANLKRLVEERMVGIGTPVIIRDGARSSTNDELRD
ncbi:MAG TPA: L,D-transpeptidase [Candidatus Obscuribacterales bacterium]